MPAIDFTDVKTTDFEPLPRGEYLIRIGEMAESDQAGPSGFTYIGTVLEVMEPEEYEGRKLFDNMSLSPKALFRLKNFLMASGYTEEDLAGEFEFDPEEFLGNEYIVRVTTRKDQDGEMRNSIKNYAGVE